MKFEIKYTKLGNLFFFVSNLSEWHFSCRQKYNNEWINLLGQFTEKEKGKLEELKRILSDFGFRSARAGILTYLGEAFITAKNQKESLKILVALLDNDTQKANRILAILKSFEEKFDTWWEIAEKLLVIDKHILDEELKSERTQLIVSEAEKFLGIKTELGKIFSVYLLAQPCQNYLGGGGANIGKSGITLEVGSLMPKHGSTEFTLGIIFHESFHLFSANSDFLVLVKKVILGGGVKLEDRFFIERIDPITIVNEIVLDSLVPRGYLGIKYLHMQMKKNNPENRPDSYYTFQITCANELMSLTEKYFNKQKSVDEEFIEFVVKRIKNLKA